MATVAKWPVIVTIPHDGHEVPDWIWQKMLALGEAPDSIRRRLFDGGDPYTLGIYQWPMATAVFHTPYSRFVVDVNRSRHAGGPNGVIKTMDFERRPFYPAGFQLEAAEIEKRLSLYWDPFYSAVDAALEANWIRQGRLLLIDGHSMSATGPVLGPDRGGHRPAICLATEVNAIGKTQATCPAGMAEAARSAAEKALALHFPEWPADNRVKMNNPFDGGHILGHCTQAANPHAIPGIMIECNRALYLDEVTLQPLPGRIETLAEITQSIAAAALAWYTTPA